MRGKKNKRLLALLLALMLIVSLQSLVMGAVAAEDDPWSIDDATQITITATRAGEDPITVTVYEDTYNTTNDFTLRILVPEGADPDAPIHYMTNNSWWIRNEHKLIQLGAAVDGGKVAFNGEEGDDVYADDVDSNDDAYAFNALKNGNVVVTAQLLGRIDLATGDYLHSPVTVADAKAVIRYLRYNADNLPAGDVEKIFVSGLSGGGALSSALGASGDAKEFLPYLYALGTAGVTYTGAGDGPVMNLGYVAKETDWYNYDPDDFESDGSDAVYAVVAHAPITDLDDADLMYGWAYNGARQVAREYFDDFVYPPAADPNSIHDMSIALGKIYGAAFPDYLKSLNLKYKGETVDATFNPEDGAVGGKIAAILKEKFLESVNAAMAGYADKEDIINAMLTPANSNYQVGALTGTPEPDGWKTSWLTWDGDVVTDIDLQAFLYWQLRQVPNLTKQKTSPAFNAVPEYASLNESGLYGQPEHEYGFASELAFNAATAVDNEIAGAYADYAAYRAATVVGSVTIGELIDKQAKLIDSTAWLVEEGSSTVAPHWYITHGINDRDTSPATVAILWLAAMNNSSVKDASLRFTWDEIHDNTAYLEMGVISTWIKDVLDNDTVNGDYIKMAKTVKRFYTVSFDSNGGSGDMDYATVVIGAVYDLPDCSLTAPEGMEFDGWSLTQDGNKITGTSIVVNSYMTLYALWKDEAAEPVSNPFTDIKETDWFYNFVMYAYEKGLMTGTDADKFSPNVTASRAMIVTVLYRMAGEPEVTGTNTFTDLTADWYKNAVQWAVTNGITNGVSDTLFDPNTAVTREQLSTFLYRYADACGYDITEAKDLSIYSDADKISTFAKDAMAWANALGIITGDTPTTLSPKDSSSRAVLATVLTRFCEAYDVFAATAPAPPAEADSEPAAETDDDIVDDAADDATDDTADEEANDLADDEQPTDVDSDLPTDTAA